MTSPINTHQQWGQLLKASSKQLPHFEWPADSPHKGPVTWKVFPCYEIIMWFQGHTVNEAPGAIIWSSEVPHWEFWWANIGSFQASCEDTDFLGLVTMRTICSKSIRPHIYVACDLINESFWNFVHSTPVCLPCSMQNFRTIHWLSWMLLLNKYSEISV